MSLEVLRSTVITAAVPVILLVASACQSYRSTFHWILWFAGMAAYTAYTFLAGDWFLFGYYSRFVLLAGYVLAIALTSVAVTGLPAMSPIGPREAAGMLFFALFAPLAIIALRGRRLVGKGIEAVFPMRDGLYWVAEGGSNAVLNHHYPARYARFALDIVKLDRSGFRARGFCPKDLNRYVVFGEMVYSPVGGTVSKAVDGIPDMVPPHQDREHPAGNHVIIKHCDSGSLILIAHLQRGSLVVREGDVVSVDQPVGRVGNSGISTEPHLHISCEVDAAEEYNLEGVGVPLLFGGKFLSRNAVVRGRHSGTAAI
jgi:hypothetical protein